MQEIPVLIFQYRNSIQKFTGPWINQWRRRTVSEMWNSWALFSIPSIQTRNWSSCGCLFLPCSSSSSYSLAEKLCSTLTNYLRSLAHCTVSSLIFVATLDSLFLFSASPYILPFCCCCRCFFCYSRCPWWIPWWRVVHPFRVRLSVTQLPASHGKDDRRAVRLSAVNVAVFVTAITATWFAISTVSSSRRSRWIPLANTFDGYWFRSLSLLDSPIIQHRSVPSVASLSKNSKWVLGRLFTRSSLDRPRPRDR